MCQKVEGKHFHSKAISWWNERCMKELNTIKQLLRSFKNIEKYCMYVKYKLRMHWEKMQLLHWVLRKFLHNDLKKRKGKAKWFEVSTFFKYLLICMIPKKGIPSIFIYLLNNSWKISTSLNNHFLPKSSSFLNISLFS